MTSRTLPFAISSSALCSLMISSLACAPTGETEVIDNVFDPCEALVLELENANSREEQQVADAIELWNARAGSLLTLDDVEHAPRMPVVFDDAPAAFNGHYDDEGAIVYINHGLEDREMEITIAHEIGHVFGLYHVNKDERPSVMNHGNLVHEPNPGDVSELSEMWGACSPAGADVAPTE